VGKKFLNRQQPLPASILPFQRRRAPRKKIFNITQEQIIFVSIVRKKSTSPLLRGPINRAR